MIAINLIFFGFYTCFTKYIEMSLIHRIFKNRKNVTKDPEYAQNIPSDAETEDLSPIRNSDSENSQGTNLGDAELEETVVNNERRSKMKQLNKSINDLRHKNNKLKHRRMEVMWLDAEISEIMSSIAMTQRQIGALEDDILNKKCELMFLKSEVSEEGVNIKTNEPVLHKRYTHLKNATDATKLLLEIRERQKIFQMLEHLTYTKCLDFKHNLQEAAKKKRSNAMLKNKQQNFGHLTGALQERKKVFNWGNKTSETSSIANQTGPEVPDHPVTTVEVVSAHMDTSTQDGGIATLFPVVSPIPRTQQVTSPLAMIPLAPLPPNVVTHV